MNSEGDARRDWRTLSLVVLGLLVLIVLANLRLEVRGEVTDVGIWSRFVHAALISFTVVSGGIFLATMALSHKHARLVEQALGTLLATVVGAFLFGLAVDSGLTTTGAASDVWSQFALGALRILILQAAGWLSIAFIFGILLVLVTGRESSPDPLLKLESTEFEIISVDTESRADSEE